MRLWVAFPVDAYSKKENIAFRDYASEVGPWKEGSFLVFCTSESMFILLSVCAILVHSCVLLCTYRHPCVLLTRTSVCTDLLKASISMSMCSVVILYLCVLLYQYICEHCYSRRSVCTMLFVHPCFHCACTSMCIAVLVPTCSTTVNVCSAIFVTHMRTGVQVHPCAWLYVHECLFMLQ